MRDDRPPSNEAARRTRILIPQAFYLPGLKLGGPVQSLANLVAQLGDVYDFHILTEDRDWGDEQPYAGIPTGVWTTVGAARVRYEPARRLFSLRLLREVVDEIRPDVIYLQSFHSRQSISTLWLRRMGGFKNVPIVLAPRGEFSPGALQIRWLKKRVFRAAAGLVRLHRGVLFQATASTEVDDIRRVFGERCRISLAANFAAPAPPAVERPAKRAGAVRLAYVSRISPKKNLAQAIRWLADVEGDVQLDLYGPVDDAGYWAQCQAQIARLPGNVRTIEHGPADRAGVQRALAEAHFFLLPTLGENFGHAIFEALAAGCPVLISDQTPWLGLAEQRAGWDVPLGDTPAWHAALRQCVRMEDAEYRTWCDGARALALRSQKLDESKAAYQALIARAMSGAA